MACIDKIYGTTKQYDDFRKWLKKKKPSAIQYLYIRNGWDNKDDRPISNFPEKIDKWLLKSCPIDWVLKRLKEQYNLN